MSREKMTIDEAIAIIRKEYLCVDRDCDIEKNCGKCDLMMPSKEPILEAYKMAIKALEQMPVITTTGGEGVIYYPQVEGVTPTVIDAGKQEPCEQDPCDNCKYLDGDGCRLVFEQAEYGKASDECPNDNNELPSVNSKRCDDCIWSVCNYNKVDWESVTPQPKTGHWIEHPEIETSTPEYLMFYECSECKDRQCFCKSDIHKKGFCSNCGCRMVEPQESEDKDADKKCTYKETGCGSCKRQLDCPIEADMAESEPQERSGEE